MGCASPFLPGVGAEGWSSTSWTRISQRQPSIETQQLTPTLTGTSAGDDVHLDARFTDDGELDLVRADGKPFDDAKSRLNPDLRGLAGRHRILFS